MYIVTFYSFRGGVGRTTALVNVGMELARRGRKVLLVDFDLESPDLAGFPSLARLEQKPGVVEFVSAYREKSVAPDVTDYLYSLGQVGTRGGQVWVMPAGKSDPREYWGEHMEAQLTGSDWRPEEGKGGPKYWEALAEIDWQSLYDREQGYLFFEDVREQWRKLGADYVLIDTHAGITPPLGITTRQLADAVVMLFNPQQGGREGLDEVSWWIHTEAERTGGKPIEQLFVAARVVDADQDPGRVYETASPVGIFKYAAVLPFSNRLLLGKQVIEQEHREDRDGGENRWLSRDRLAQEYRKLANAIIEANFAHDQDGTLLLLRKIHADPSTAIGGFDGGQMSHRDYSDALKQIIDAFPNNAAILAQAACCLYGAARYGRALYVLDQAVDLQQDSPELLWQRASYRRRLNMTPGAVSDLLKLLGVDPQKRDPSTGSEEDFLESLLDPWAAVDWRFDLPEELREGETSPIIPDYSDALLDLPGIDPYIASAVRQLRQLSPEAYEEAKQKPAVATLSPEAQAILFAEALPAREEEDPHGLIRARKWAEAVALLAPRLTQSDGWPLEDAVCLFIAWWGLGNESELRKCGEMIRNQFEARRPAVSTWFRKKLSKHASVSAFQIVAAACWKGGAIDIARFILDRLEERVPLPDSARIFSYWRFHDVSWEQFKEDCDLMRQLFNGTGIRPPFMGKEPGGG